MGEVQFKPKHLEWLQELRGVRPDCKIGIIDNGSYVQYMDCIESSGFKFDWLDISIDGPKETHNKQRASGASFDIANSGIQNAHRILTTEGKVNSLFTLTKINFNSLLETSRILPREIFQWHVTTITPLRAELACLSVSEEEFAESWRQLMVANKTRSVHLRIYVVDDLLKLARVVGKDNFLKAFSSAYVDLASISFDIEGLRVIYYPQSVAPSETWVIDADGSYHVPYSIGFTLEELRRGISVSGEDIRKYTVQEGGEVNFQMLYAKAVEQWKREFGLMYLEQEKSVFDQIRNF